MFSWETGSGPSFFLSVALHPINFSAVAAVTAMTGTANLNIQISTLPLLIHHWLSYCVQSIYTTIIILKISTLLLLIHHWVSFCFQSIYIIIIVLTHPLHILHLIFLLLIFFFDYILEPQIWFHKGPVQTLLCDALLQSLHHWAKFHVWHCWGKCDTPLKQ